MKFLLCFLALLTGGFMLIDGIHVMARGKYIGPEKPGPWAELFYAVGVDVFTLGPLFIVYGLAWLIFLIAWWKAGSRAFLFGIILSIATLWYLPIGTLCSLIVLLLLIRQRTKEGNLPR